MWAAIEMTGGVVEVCHYTFELYRQARGDDVRDDELVASVSQPAVFIGPRIEVGPVWVEVPGTYYWVVQLRGAGGSVVHADIPRRPEATTEVIGAAAPGRALASVGVAAIGSREPWGSWAPRGALEPRGARI